MNWEFPPASYNIIVIIRVKVSSWHNTHKLDFMRFFVYIQDMWNQNKLVIGLIIGIPVLVWTVMGVLSWNWNTIPIECESVCKQTINDLTQRLSELQSRFDTLNNDYLLLESIHNKHQLWFQTQSLHEKNNTQSIDNQKLSQHTNWRSYKELWFPIDRIMRLINDMTYRQTVTTVIDWSRLETLRIVNTHTNNYTSWWDRTITIYATWPTVYLWWGGARNWGGNNPVGWWSGGNSDPLRPFSPYFRCSSPWWWTPLDHGDSIFAYAQNTVEYPTACKGENRVCDNGTLKWSYTSKTCIQVWDQCSTDRWILTHGQTINAYSANSVPYGSDCSSKIEVRKCLDGTLWGTAPFKTCTISEPKWCLWPDGRVWWHTVIAVYYQYAKVLGEPKDGVDLCPRETRKCLNGIRYVPDWSTTKNFIFNKSHCVAEVP